MIRTACRFAYSLIALLTIFTFSAHGQTATPGHCSANSPSGYSGFVFDGPYTYADYMGGYLAVHFHINPGRLAPGATVGLTLFTWDDQCTQTYPLRFVNFGFSFTTTSVEFFSLRFSSPTHYDVWNDLTNQVVTDCVGCSGEATGTLPTYEEVSVYLQTPGLNEFVITTTYAFYPVEGAAPIRTGTLPTPPGCVSSSIGGYFFDPYEHVEYLNGFLAWHFRFAGSYPDGRTWTSHMNLHDAGCNLIGNSFQFYGTPTNLPLFTRYWSVRFSSPTHYDIWSDETNTMLSCPGCSADLPDPATQPYTYVSFFGFVDGTASTLFSTPFPVTSNTAPPPSISSISTASGTLGQIIPNFTVTGTNFGPNATLSFGGSGIAVSTPYLTKTSTQIVASISIAGNAPLGAQDVIVTNPDSQVGKLPGAFSIFVPVPPIPGPPPPPAGTGSAGTSQNPQVPLAEPISTGNGNYYYQHTDFVIPGRSLPLVFQRSYNALDNYAGPLGNNWTHSYNVILTGTSDGTVNIRWGDGHGETFTPSGGGYSSQPGVFSTLVRNSGNTFALTQKDQSRFAFASTGKLTSITDRNGNTTLFAYDSNGNLTQIRDTVDRALTFSYDASNRITQVADPAGRSVALQYSSTNDLITAMDPAGGITRFAYDANHRLTSITLPTGNVLLQNTYDGAGRATSQTNGRGATTAIAYDTPNIGDRTITDARGNHTVHTYDASLRIAKVTDALSGTTSFTYDANNDRTTITKPNGETTNFSYDSRGNITSIADPLANTIQFAYDSRNDLLSATNAKGKTTTFSYDSNGNLSAVQDALANSTTFGYDSFGELRSKTDARGNATHFAYDSTGNLIRITDALGKATNLAYDSIGRLLSITDPNAHTATASYDALSRLTRIADPLGNQTQFAYDAVGNLLKITDAKGSATSYAYDATNNLASVTDALGRVTRYAYDPNNNRVTFTNAKGNTNSYAYDSLNRLSVITDPLGFATAYGYDAVGNVTSVNDPNGRTNQFVYDALNRLLGISYGDGKTVAYSYDANGNRTSMTDSHGLTNYSYDDLDRLTSANHPGGKLVSYAYDAVGNRVSMGYPDGKVATYAYDAVNRPSQATDWLARSTKYTYDPASNLTKTLYPNGASVGFTYDAANRLTSVVNSTLGLPLLTLAYALDRVGNRTSLSVNGVKTTFAYDALNELLGVAQLGPLKSAWTYDAVGNRTKETSPLGATQYTYDAADRLLSAGATTFTYDPNGNQLSKRTPQGTLTYAYDAANRLMGASARGIASTYSYDGDGNRVTQTTSAGAYNYVNDVVATLPVVLNEQGPDGNITYGYGLGLIEEASPTFNYFYHYDGLGSVVGLTDATGKPRAAYAYDAWGNPLLAIPDSVGIKNKFRFTGEALDPGTGLYYLRARYYDPSVGRLITRDPLVGSAFRPQTLNRYAYALGNPINFADPSGLAADSGESAFDFSRILHRGGELLGETIDRIGRFIPQRISDLIAPGNPFWPSPSVYANTLQPEPPTEPKRMITTTEKGTCTTQVIRARRRIELDGFHAYLGVGGGTTFLEISCNSTPK